MVNRHALLRPSYDFSQLPQVGALTLSAGVITDTVRAAGVEGDGGAIGDGVGVWPAATNLVTNGGFETNTTGWGARGSPNGPSIARTTAESKFGGASLAVTIGTGYQSDWGAAFDNSSNYVAVTGGATYTLSVWVKSNGSNTVTLRVFERDGAKATIGIPVNGSGSTSSGWVKLVLTATANASAAYWQIIVGAGSAADVSFTFYIDGVQLETGSISTPYIETDGGTASRVAGSIVWASPGALFNSTQGAAVFRVRVGFSYATAGTRRVFAIGTSPEILDLYHQGSTGWVLRDVAAGTASYTISSDVGLVAGDTRTILIGWDANKIYISVAGAAWPTGTSRAGGVSSPSGDMYVGLNYGGSQFYGDILSAAFLLGPHTVLNPTTINSWGNNRPLPHMFPQSADVRFLAHFYGDGTQYRWSAA